MHKIMEKLREIQVVGDEMYNILTPLSFVVGSEPKLMRNAPYCYRVLSGVSPGI